MPCTCGGSSFQIDYNGFCAGCSLWETPLQCSDNDNISFDDDIVSLPPEEEVLNEQALCRLHRTWVAMHTNYLEVPLYKKDTWTSPGHSDECVQVLSEAVPCVTKHGSTLDKVLTEFSHRTNYEVREVTRLQNRNVGSMHNAFKTHYNIHNQCTAYHGKCFLKMLVCFCIMK